MIILGNRATASHMKKSLTHHLLHGADNESIEILLGGELHIAACIAAAKKKRAAFAIRHFVISPHVEISNADILWIRDALAKEFGFNPDHVTLIRHAKPRLDEATPAPHFHLLAAEVDPANSSKVLSSAWSYARHEAVARLAELHLGHRVVPGPHQKAVVRRYDAEGNTAVADALRDLEPPRSAGDAPTGWSAPTAAPIARANLSPAETIGAVRDAFGIASSAAEFLQAIAAIGLSVRPGEKRSTTPCLFAGDRHLGALHRILGRNVSEIREFLAPPSDAGMPDIKDAFDAPALPVYLTEAEVSAAFDRLIAQAPVEPVDKTEMVRLQATMNNGAKMAAGQRDEIDAAKDDRAELVGDLARLGWLGRHIFRRRKARDIEAKIAESDARIEDVERFLRTIAETHKPIRAALQKTRQVVESREAAASLKREREVDRLSELKMMVIDRGLQFLDAGEVAEFAAERHDEDGFVIKRPDIFGNVRRPDPDVGRVPGGL